MAKSFRHFAAGVMIACTLSISMPTSAQEKSAVRPGFNMAPGTARIILFRPSIKVGEQSMAGLFEPNAEWTEQAKGNIDTALDAAERKLGNQIILVDEPVGEAAQTLAAYRSLFSVVAQAVITYKFFPGNRLPTKKREGVFDWTLGPGVAAIPGGGQAGYALFILTEDQYGSTGRKIAQFFAAAAGVGITSGVHKGFAGLIDLKTGDLVWLNADLKMGGDVRTADGARHRVAQLLEDFPGRPAEIASAAK